MIRTLTVTTSVLQYQFQGESSASWSACKVEKSAENSVFLTCRQHNMLLLSDCTSTLFEGGSLYR